MDDLNFNGEFDSELVKDILLENERLGQEIRKFKKYNRNLSMKNNEYKCHIKRLILSLKNNSDKLGIEKRRSKDLQIRTIIGSKVRTDDELTIAHGPGEVFYKSRIWLDLRFNFLKNKDRKCCLCGSKEEIQVDHIKPRYIYPELALNYNNLQILCKPCNLGKGLKSTKIIVRKSE